ncbi:MAG TPA: hypothetical protein PKD00_00085 [Burkholderiales bacterium]|nr:hypothetical protein [Burkholderiales bacterium]
MKTTLSKHLILLSFIIMIIMLNSCKPKTDYLETVDITYSKSKTVIIDGIIYANFIVIDSCQYIIGNYSGTSNYFLTHKGNCQNCLKNKCK